MRFKCYLHKFSRIICYQATLIKYKKKIYSFVQLFCVEDIFQQKENPHFPRVYLHILSYKVYINLYPIFNQELMKDFKFCFRLVVVVVVVEKF